MGDMHSEPEFTADLTGFAGAAPLLPVPGVVLFPHVAVPLQMTDPGDRRMAADALASNRLIALALPRSRPEGAGGSSVEIHGVVCLGRITSSQKLPGGRYNIVLTGLQRARCIGEHVHELPYRVADLVLQPDVYGPTSDVDRDDRKRELLQSFRRLLRTDRTDSLFRQMLDADLPLGVLCDLLAAALRISPLGKYRALREVDVDQRSELLLDAIQGVLSGIGRNSMLAKYPPRFSLN